MNYQEMVNAQQNLASNQETLPFGKFYRKQIDGKYYQVIDLKQELSDSIVFCEAIKKDQEWTTSHKSNHQMQFVLDADESGSYRLILEQGSYQPLSQLLYNEPATIAVNGFIDKVINSLFDMTERLHSDSILQLCYAPQNIFVRKGDTNPLLLCHGSFYTGVNDVQSLYAGVENYVAPEVMSREGCDERSDVYGMGCLIAFLFEQGSMPLEYKQVVKKATAADPAKRFKTIQQMRSAIAAKRSMLRSAIALLVALVIAFLGVWLYLELVPQTNYIEFVEPAPQENAIDPYADGQFDPELGLIMGDSIAMSEEDRKYMAKAEDIFRKRFEAVAEESLSKIYDNKRMNSSEKRIMAGDQKMVEELMKLETEMATEMGISEERAAAIALDVITHITTEKQEGLTKNGYIKGDEVSE